MSSTTASRIRGGGRLFGGVLCLLIASCRTCEVPDVVAELNPPIAEMLQSDRDPPCVQFVDRVEGGAYAITERDHIELGPVAQGEDLRFCLAHEMAHWHSDFNPPWTKLTGAFQEGLADYVACSVTPGYLDKRVQENQSLGNIRFILEHLYLPRRQWNDLSKEEAMPCVRLTFEVIRRIGLPELRELLSSGTTSPEALLEKAEIAPVPVD